MDPFVVDIPWIARFLLVNGIILRTRPKKSAEAYRKIWTDRGSPLLFHTVDLAEKLQKRMGENYRVLPVMRYGSPSVASALEELRRLEVSSIIVLPLYPQYAEASTRSGVEWVRAEARRLGMNEEIRFAPAFYGEETFLRAFADNLVSENRRFGSDFVLFSFHGLPERQIRKIDHGGRHCLSSDDCCDRITDANSNCYRAQCYFTARRIAEIAAIPKENYAVGFQSRLGRTPWIRPYSDFLIRELPKEKGAKRLLVCSPSFVADCLETIEEIGLRSKADFIAAGGEDLALVPSLNSSDAWVECVRGLVLAVARA